MADDISLMQGQEDESAAQGFGLDTKQSERNKLQPFMESIAQPDVGKRMQEGTEAVDRGLQQYNIEAQSQYDMAVRAARERVAAAQTASEGDTAQSIADRKLLADQLAMPFSVVTKAQEEAKRELVVRNLSQNQYMSMWASQNEVNATYARDYLDTVVDFFQDAPNWGNELMHWLTFDSGKAVERLGYNLTEGAAQANKNWVELGRMFAENIGMEPAAKYLEGVSQSLDRYRNLAEQNGVGRSKEDKVGALWDEFVKSVPQQAWNLMSLALFKRPMPGTLAVGAGEVAGARAAAAVNPLLAKAGEGLAGTGIMAAQIAGGSYGELREQGVSPEIAGIAAAGNALMQAPMEKIGLESFVDIFRAKGMREAMLKAVTSIFSEGATEWAQKWPEYLAHTWALSEKHGNNVFDRANWFVSNLFDWKNIQQANDEAMLEAAVGAMWGGLGGGVRIAMTRNMQQKAREQADFLLGVRQITQMAIDKGMPPEVVKTMLEAKQPLMASTGYVDAEAALTLYQEGNAAVLDALGVTEEQLTQLADEGGAVPIQLSDLETRVDQATFDQLYQHVSIRPGAHTAAEGAQPMDANAYTRSALAEARRKANQIPGVSQELSRMYHELLDSGISRQQARDNTTLLAVQAATLQAKGFDALSWLKRRKYVVGEDGQTYTVPVGIPQTEGAELVSEDVRNQIAASTDKDALSKMYFDNQQAIDAAGENAQERDRLQAVNAMVTARLAMLNSSGVTLNQFYGEQGVRRLDEAEKTTRLADLDVARQMESAGKDAQAVKLATGWERGADGKWRYEMPDAVFQKNFKEKLQGGKAIPLWNLLRGGKNNQLLKAYPQLTRYKIRLSDEAGNWRGYFSKETQTLVLSRDRAPEIESTVYHELQHAIQEAENFSRGGNPRQFPNYRREVDSLQEIYDAWRRDAKVDEFIKKSLAEFKEKKKTVEQHFADLEAFENGSEFAEQLKAAKEQVQEYINWYKSKYGTAYTPEEIYARLIGEVEARNVQKRMGMTPEERRASLASATEDVAREDQIKLGVVSESALQEEFSGDGPAPDAEVVGGPTLYQVQNLPEWKERLRAWGKANDISARKIEKFIKGIEGQMKIIDALKTKDGLAISDLIAQQVRGAGQAKPGRSKAGFRASGPIRTNIDEIYQISFDASSMCVKRLSAAKTAAAVQSRIGRPLTADENMALIALYRAEGKEAPCIYCYVESNRRRATEAVGDARDMVAGTKDIPEGWKPDRKKKVEAAREEFKQAGLTREDINADFVLDPATADTEQAIETKKKFPAIYGFLNFEAANTKQNKVKLYEEYVGNLLDLKKEQVELLNGYAGLRFFSTSDFQIEHVVDLMQAFADMAAIGAKSHAYTKVPLYVDIFGDTGQKINMSCFAEEDPETGEIRPDIAQGWDWETAKEMRAKHKDCGVILVASSDNVLRWAMEQDWIDYIIPFHYSGLSKEYYNTLGWQDFQAIQTEQAIEGLQREITDTGAEKGRVRMHEITNPKKEDKVKGVSDKVGTRRYLTLCKNRGLYPVFTSFCFKQEVFADIEEKYADKLKNAKDNEARMNVLSKIREKCEKRAKAMWKDMVEKDKIDWSKINEKAFKFKKDYARTDTAFNVVNPAKINMQAAAAPLQETIEAGLDEKYKEDPSITEKLVKLIDWSAANGNAPIGAKALQASRAKVDPMSYIMGGPAYPTAYKRPNETQGVTLQERQQSRTPAQSIESVRRQYAGTKQWMKAPNGQPTKLTERQWLQVRTPEFKQWFGDWENDPENASKIVDENGEPLVVYHQTESEFDVFDISKARQDSDIPAFFFSSGTEDWGDMGERTIPAFLNMRNPKQGKPSARGEGRKVRDQLVADGFDGTIEAEEDEETEYAVFNPNQIKDAERNTGAFSADNPSILYQSAEQGQVSQSFVDYVNELFQRAWHGSPFKFDRFTLEHVGEGEGAQVHGWGLYFAKQREVGEGYRRKLIENALSYLVNGKKIEKDELKNILQPEDFEKIVEYAEEAMYDEGTTSGQNDVDLISYMQNEIDDVDKYISEIVPDLKERGWDEKKINEHVAKQLGVKEKRQKLLDKVKGAGLSVSINKDEGQLYEVEIPDNDVLLDEQKSFDEQPEVVKKAFLTAKEELTKKYGNRVPIRYIPDQAHSGEGMYAYLRDTLGSAEAASRWLSEHGVKGITYEGGIDGRCYVVFDDEAIQIYNTLYQAMEASKASSPRGSYTRTVQGEDLIRIFQGHDASTVPHESAHAYHQLLEDMAADDGMAARQSCVDALIQTGMLRGVAEQYANIPVEEMGQVVAELQAQVVHFDESMNVEGADKEAIANDKKTILAQIDAITQLQRHHVAVEQARQDLKTIREWAGVPVEGALTREQYIQAQEQFARGFEGYLATGKAPTTALAGVFARFKQWLLAIYKNIRDYVGADITPEIKDVYDRMLATEEEMQADEVAQTMLGEMPDAIAMLGCNASDYAFLEDLLTRAHMAASSRVDKERAKDRRKRYKAAYDMALTSLMEQPLWRLATGGYGRINYESLQEYLNKKEANELRKRLPKVIVSGDGSSLDVIAMGFDDEMLSREFGGNADDIAQMLYEHIVLNGEKLQDEAKALANQALESQDAEYTVEDGLLAGDEYGDFLDALEDEAAKMQRRASAKGKKKAEAREAAAEQKAEEAQAEAEARAKAKAEREAKLACLRGERKALWAEYQRRAKEELDATPVGQIDPKRYAAMLRKALKGKDNAILSRDPDKAVEAVRKARYAYALMREAKRRRDMVERNLSMVEKLCRRKPGDIAPVPATALARLLQTYGFRVPKRWGGDPAHENDSMQALASACIAEAQGEDTVEVTPDLAEWVMQEAVPDYAQDASWQSLTWADYNDLMDVFNFFVHASKEQNQNSKDSMKARVEFCVEQGVQSMQGMETLTSAPKGSWRRAWQNVSRRIFGAIQALQWQFRKADGFKNAGPKGEAGALESLVMRPILEGENEFRARMKELSKLLAEPLERLRQTGLRLQTEYGNKNGELIKLNAKLPEALSLSEGRSSWTTDQVIALALNSGNKGNRQRITGGYPDLGYDTLAAIVGSDLAAQICQDNAIEVPEDAVYQSGIFTADDWAAVQQIWDAIETLWEPTVKVHREMYGFAPRRVDVEPMSFRAQGVPVALRGGYYPIYYDKDISLEAQSWGERDDIMSTTESFFPAPSAKRGHTKSRQAKTKHPLRLSTSTLMDHVQDALKLICFGEAVRFADKVTRHPVFAAEYTRIFGQEDYKAIRPNLKGVVRSEPAPKDAMIKLANATRKYLVSAGLWGNLKVAILQTTALGPAMGDLGAVPVWQAMGRIATGGWGLIREIQQASPYMMSRWRAFDQDLLDKAQSLDINKRPRTVKIGNKEISWDDVVNAGMTPLCLVDLVTSGAIWQAAYSKYMKGKGLPGSLNQGAQYHAEAVQFADEEVKKSNPDFDASSRSAFLRAQNSYRLFNAFGSAVTLMAQRGEYMWEAMKHKRITKAQYARWEAYEMLAPAVAMTLIMALARGIVGGGDDDGEKLAALFFESLLDQYSMKVPFFGSIIEGTIESAAGISNSGRQPTMRTALDTPVNLFYRIPTTLPQAWNGDEEARKKASYAIGDVVSFVLRVPVSKIIRNAERGYDQWQRGEGTPVSMVMPAPGK